VEDTSFDVSNNILYYAIIVTHFSTYNFQSPELIFT